MCYGCCCEMGWIEYLIKFTQNGVKSKKTPVSGERIGGKRLETNSS